MAINAVAVRIGVAVNRDGQIFAGKGNIPCIRINTIHWIRVAISGFGNRHIKRCGDAQASLCIDAIALTFAFYIKGQLGISDDVQLAVMKDTISIIGIRIAALRYCNTAVFLHNNG